MSRRSLALSGAALEALDRRRGAAIRRARLADTRQACASLYGFIQQAWPVLEPSTPFLGGWSLQTLCDHLEAVTRGDITRLLVTIPPGMMKSLAVSVFWPAWEWGPAGRPQTRYLATSFSDANVTRDALKMRRLVSSPWYQDLWGDRVELTADQNAKARFENTRSGVREGRAFTSLTGARADRVIIDDPHSVDTAESQATRESTIQTFREAVTDRLNDPDRSAIVVIMQRLHQRDVAGVILATGMPYVHLNLPMAFEAGSRCRTIIGFVDPRTYDGELLFPERFPQHVVDQLRRDKGEYAWASQYQQRPAPRDGGLFKRDWFEIVDIAPSGGQACRAWDLAATVPLGGRDPDWTVGVRVRRAANGAFYVENVIRRRGTPLQVEQWVHAAAWADGRDIRIELPQDPGQAGKAQASSFVRLLAGFNVHARSITGDKATRAGPAAAQAEAGHIKLVRGAWNEAFLEELCVFPSGAHDDQVDALADAINALSASRPIDYSMWG